MGSADRIGKENYEPSCGCGRSHSALRIEYRRPGNPWGGMFLSLSREYFVVFRHF